MEVSPVTTSYFLPEDFQGHASARTGLYSIRSFISGPSALVLVQPKKDRPNPCGTLLSYCFLPPQVRATFNFIF